MSRAKIFPTYASACILNTSVGVRIDLVDDARRTAQKYIVYFCAARLPARPWSGSLGAEWFSGFFPKNRKKTLQTPNQETNPPTARSLSGKGGKERPPIGFTVGGHTPRYPCTYNPSLYFSVSASSPAPPPVDLKPSISYGHIVRLLSGYTHPGPFLHTFVDNRVDNVWETSVGIPSIPEIGLLFTIHPQVIHRESRFVHLTFRLALVILSVSPMCVFSEFSTKSTLLLVLNREIEPYIGASENVENSDFHEFFREKSKKATPLWGANRSLDTPCLWHCAGKALANR